MLTLLFTVYYAHTMGALYAISSLGQYLTKASLTSADKSDRKAYYRWEKVAQCLRRMKRMPL